MKRFFEIIFFVTIFPMAFFVLFILWTLVSIAELGRDYEKHPMTRDEWKSWTF